MKEIKRRISSVNSTKQIMKAMNLLSTAKLQKTRESLKNIQPLYENIKLVMDSIKQGASGEEDNVFLEQRDVKNVLYVVITGDQGLCGGYNLNVQKEALAYMNALKDKQEKIIAVGAKGRDYFRRRDKEIVQKYPAPSQRTVYEDAAKIGDHVVSMYTAGEVDEAYLVYTHFESALSHVPYIVKLLPISANSDEDNDSNEDIMSFDPDINTFIEYAVPMYLKMFIYGAMMESAVCENAARMTSMDAATRNAEEIIDDLTLEYNRTRQSMITQEITEIVSGANALQ